MFGQKDNMAEAQRIINKNHSVGLPVTRSRLDLKRRLHLMSEVIEFKISELEQFKG